ncbi:MAG: transcriptional regulator, partial [Vicinamibacteria bacterium]
MAGTLGVALHDRFNALKWLAPSPSHDKEYVVTATGDRAFASLDVDVESSRAQRRRFAYACLDWSERRPHLGGSLAAAILKMALKRKWVEQDLDSRALEITRVGRRELQRQLDLAL